MKTDELLKAIGDMDEKYIAEASEPIVPKWKKYARWTAIAATICVVVGGGTMLAALNSGSGAASKDGLTGQGEADENGTAGSDSGDGATGSGGEDQDAAAGMNSGGATQDTGYAFLFQSKDKWDITYEVKFAMEQGGPAYLFKNAKDMPTLPFDTTQFAEIRATLYSKNNGEIPNTLIELIKDEEKHLDIVVNTKGYYVECRAKDLHDGVELRGVTVYAYDMSANMDESDLRAFFTDNGKSYSIQAWGLSYNEVGTIIDEIIQNGISADDFDLSKATKELPKYEVNP